MLTGRHRRPTLRVLRCTEYLSVAGDRRRGADGPGTLYGAIERLELDGLVEALPADDRRTPYRLTSAGSDYLARRIDGLQVLAGVGRSRLSA